MEFIINYWYVVVAVAAVLAAVGLTVYRCVGLPGEAQLAKVREWLLWAVTEAEKELGGGTGKLKLRQVYDLFVTRFPWLARTISFDLFAELVDDALDEMHDMLKSNKAVQLLVSGEDTQNTIGVVQQ